MTQIWRWVSRNFVDVILLYLELLVLFGGVFGLFWVFVIIPFRKCYEMTFSERYIHHQMPALAYGTALARILQFLPFPPPRSAGTPPGAPRLG